MIKVEDYYNMIITFKKNMKTELPVISISIFLFLTLWSFFGKYNMILPPFLTLYFKVKYQQEFRIRELIKNYLMILTIAFMSFLAGESLIFCILINLAVPFFIVYFLTNKFTPKSYFVYGMAFVFMQLMPIPSSLLPMRIGALLYSFIVLTVALFFSSKYLKKEKKYDKLREKLLLLSHQIKKLTFGESIEEEGERLESILNLLKIALLGINLKDHNRNERERRVNKRSQTEY